MREWDDYWSALTAGDRTGALCAVRRAHEAGATPKEIIDALVMPAQERIGELWLDGSWSVEEEHAATAINEGLVHWLGSFAPQPPADRPLVLVSCIETEQHVLPALVIAEELGLAGFRVEMVGPDPDPGHLLRQVLVRKPRAVLFSGSLTSSLATQKSLFGNIAAIGIPVVVGGRAFGADATRARALGATAYAPTIEDAVRLLEDLPARVPPASPPERGPGDVEAAWINEYRHQITPYVVRALARRHGSGHGLGPQWWDELEGHVDHVLGCLAASLVTGDETIMIEVRDWVTQLLQRRGADPGMVDEIWELVAEPLRGHPLARVHLAGSATPVAGQPSERPDEQGGPAPRDPGQDDRGLDVPRQREPLA